jgi:hypothetical protein
MEYCRQMTFDMGRENVRTIQFDFRSNSPRLLAGTNTRFEE